MRPVNKPTPPRADQVEELALTALKIGDKLTLMRMMLQDTIGYYCSFCEMPITVSQAVTSKYTRVLKRMPTVQDWDGLLLACDYCQVHRTADVSNLGDYLWPDTDATFSLGASSPFIYTMRDVTYVVVNDDGNRVTSTKPLVIVSANPLSPNVTKAKRTIDLFQLNTPFYDVSNNTFTIANADLQAMVDPRVDLRTKAWGAAAIAVTSLRQAKTFDSDIYFESVVKLAAGLAQASGFWSGWMMAIWTGFADQNLVKRMLLEIDKRDGYQVGGFQTVPDGGSPPWTIFTGTAVNRLTF
jgi:hypothetical protein